MPQSGATLADLHKGVIGLREAEARTRLDLLGPNEIPFRVEPFGTLMVSPHTSVAPLPDLKLHDLVSGSQHR